jgi:phosphatidylinositol-3-phosphatase
MSRRRVARPRRPARRPRVQMAVALMGVVALVAAGITIAASASSHKTRGGTPAGDLTAHQLHVEHVAHLGLAPSGRARTGGNQFCGTLLGKKSHITHVVWIMMENRSYSEVIGAPYISTLAKDCGVATNYHNITHPSLPNYIALTSGRPMAQLPKTDCGGVACMVPGPSIFTQTSSWGVFAESEPGNCVRHDVRPYVAHHTAAPFYSALTNCASNDVPLTRLNLAALPAFSLIVPNVNNDMHEKSSSVTAGDAWLRVHLGAILASKTYQSGSTIVFVTWDEGGVPRATNNCATNTTDQGCHVALLVMSPYLPAGARFTGLANHYSLLDATEGLLGLPLLGQASAAPEVSPLLGS